LSNSKRIDGGPAFPCSSIPCGIDKHPKDCRCDSIDGMSIRDYFAARSIPGVMAHGLKENVFDPEAIAQDAYKVADAMLAERAKVVGDV